MSGFVACASTTAIIEPARRRGKLKSQSCDCNSGFVESSSSCLFIFGRAQDLGGNAFGDFYVVHDFHAEGGAAL